MHIKIYEIYYKATSQTRNVRIKTSLFVHKKVFLMFCVLNAPFLQVPPGLRLTYYNSKKGV